MNKDNSEVKMKVNSIGIAGRITLNTNSLNNEGSEGNFTYTRKVSLIDKNGDVKKVPAVSGDMLKHIITKNLWKYAINENLNLSETSKNFDANRITSRDIEGEDAASYTASMIENCSLSDVAGAMVTDLNLARKSTVEFGWLLGNPEASKNESHLHVKYVSNPEKTETDDDEDDEGQNTGQNLFHIPTNSSTYAFVNYLDIERIGYNNHSSDYSINDDERMKRYRAVLKALAMTMLRLEGAMTSTQLPHLANFEGAITYSNSIFPSPMISPLNDEYKEQIKKIAEKVSSFNGDSIKCKNFDSMSEFIDLIKELLKNTEPGKIKYDDEAE